MNGVSVHKKDVILACDSGLILLQCPDKLKKSHKMWANETFILVEKSNVALEGGWKK